MKYVERCDHLTNIRTERLHWGHKIGGGINIPDFKEMALPHQTEQNITNIRS